MLLTSERILPFALILLVFTLFAAPTSAAIQSSATTNWLIGQSQPDGSIWTAVDIALPLQSTAEAVRALRSLGKSEGKELASAEQFIEAENLYNTEFLARKIIEKHGAGGDSLILIEALLKHQNSDGGFGDLIGYPSTVLDTAFALKALAIAGISASKATEAAVAFLLDRQGTDGGFITNSSSPSSIYVTAMVSMALQPYLFTYNVAAALERATRFLYQRQIPDGGWQTDWETALSLLAVVPVTTDVSRYAPAIKLLRARQSANGSWQDNVYATALALRALHRVDHVTLPVDSAKGTINGRVLDNASGLPMAGVTISVDGPPSETQSGNDGRFQLIEIAPGDYTLQYRLAGYGTAHQQVTVRAGQHVNLGVLRLEPLPDVGLITGIVTDQESGLSIAGAQLQVSGVVAAVAITTADGGYSIPSPPGPVTVSASAPGYDPVQGTGQVIAGASLRFSPALRLAGEQPPQPYITLRGIVVDGDSDEPLANTAVVVADTPHGTVTTADGVFQLAAVPPGELTVKVTPPGYHTAWFTIMAPAGSIIDVGTLRLFKMNIPESSTVTGVVLDADTGKAISGATIEAHDIHVITDAYGHFRVEGIHTLAFEVTTGAVGYLSLDNRIVLTQHGLVNLEIRLNRATYGGVDIMQLATDKEVYPAYSEIRIAVTLQNTSNEARVVRLYVRVTDESNAALQQYPAVQVPMGGNLDDAYISLLQNSIVESTVTWYNDNIPPGGYALVVQAFDALSGNLLAERSIHVQVDQTRQIETLDLGSNVRYTTLGSTEDLAFHAVLKNRSNVPFELTISYRWLDPKGNELLSGSATAEVDAGSDYITLPLGNLTHHFVASGEYSIEIDEVMGVDPLTLRSDSVFVAPGTRLDIIQDINPSTVIPDENKRIHIRIKLQGVQAQ